MLVSGCWFLGAGFWSLVAGCWLLDTGCWSLDAGFWMLDTESWALVAGKPTRKILNSGLWMWENRNIGYVILDVGCHFHVYISLFLIVCVFSTD